MDLAFRLLVEQNKQTEDINLHRFWEIHHFFFNNISRPENNFRLITIKIIKITGLHKYTLDREG